MSADHSELSNLSSEDSADITAQVINPQDDDEQSDIAQNLANYTALLKVLDPPNTKDTLAEEDVLNLLLARDALQSAIGSDIPPRFVIRIAELDRILYDKRSIVVYVLALEQWREMINPPESHWWWFLQPPEVHDAWDNLDWLWNLLTLGFLAGFASLMSQIVPLIFADGVGIFESFGLVGPGALLTMVGSNVKGGEGQEKFAEKMAEFGIPKRFCSEVTCLLAAALFGGAMVARQNLPKYYFQSSVKKGTEAYNSSQLVAAEESFNRALKIPDQESEKTAQVYTYLGLIEESIGENEKAIENYNQAVQLGNNQAINNLGRVYIAKGDFEEAETYLKIGIQRTQDNSVDELPETLLLQYQLRRNLGWTYLEQKRYNEAERELKTAIKIGNKLPDDTLGRGIASCFLGHIYNGKNDIPQGQKYARRCRELGRPETIAEYRAIVKMHPSIAQYVTTKGIF
ncbi:MAG: tetratricopeptide repeat protein [Pseudanabaenaceae cyanobacterium]